MEPIKAIAPVFIAKTRSFWLGIFPSILTLIDTVVRLFTETGNEPVAEAIAALLHPLTGWSADQIRTTMLAIAPIWALIVAQQRSGLARPYTIDPAKERTVVEIVQDGKSAFEEGKRVGEALRKAGGSGVLGSVVASQKGPPPAKR